MAWYQRVVTLAPKRRGCHLVTDEFLGSKGLTDDIAAIEIGLAHFFMQHTSASLTLNENYDPDVTLDMEDALNRVAPESVPGGYRHSMEGKDDMPAHVKSTLVGASITVPSAKSFAQQQRPVVC